MGASCCSKNNDPTLLDINNINQRVLKVKNS